MAVTQTDANKQGWVKIAQEDDDGYFYTTLGGIRVYVGSGSPHAVITAPLGSIYVECTSGALWCKTSSAANTTWAEAT